MYVTKLNTGRPSPFKGMKNRYTEETKRKIGEAGKGRIMSEETKKKLSQSNKGQVPWIKGKTHSLESRKKFSGENNGNWTGGKEISKRKEALRRYNISIEDYDKLLKKQDGKCKICGQPEKIRKYLSVDHDHKCCDNHKSCGKCIRGLLCLRCNKMLGMAYDNIEILKSSIRYLEK